MLVNNLAITYKCYSSIGNSLELSIMMQEVLRTFVSETYAVYALYCIEKNNTCENIAHFGKIADFNPNLYSKYTNRINKVYEENKVVLILRLDYGSMFIVIKQLDSDVDFFVSMFESFITKLNLSIMSCLNVQEMKEKNQLLKIQKKELEKANKSKDDFLANMSHELKTPLNSINVISSVMKMNKNGNLSKRDIKNLEIIQSSGDYLLEMINDVLDVSKLESGKVVVDYEEIKLKKLLEEISNMFFPQFKEKNINFSFEFDDNIDYIYSDVKKIKQIVKNLLSNAVKFVKDGKSIYLRVKDEDEYVNISVEDEGIGIPEDRFSDIFDRFKQADASTTRKFGGTGLGLAITKELLELLKGSIFLKSRVGLGTTFYITLPKNSNTIKCLDMLTLDDKNKEKSSNLNKSSVRKKILIYNTDVVKFINVVIGLQKEHNLIQVKNMDELFEKIKEEFDVLILDSKGISKHELNELKDTVKNDIYVIKDNIVDIADIKNFIGSKNAK